MRLGLMQVMGKQLTVCILAGQGGWDDQAVKEGATSGPWGHRLCCGCRSAKKGPGHQLLFSVPELMGRH